MILRNDLINMSEALNNNTWGIQEQKALYRNGSSEEFKQDYWNRMFCADWWRSETDDFPINLSEFRSRVNSLEPNFSRFIPWIMLALGDLGFSWTIDDIFILDNEAKNYLDSRLIENLWDLYYNTLADFLEELKDATWFEWIKRASDTKIHCFLWAWSNWSLQRLPQSSIVPYIEQSEQCHCRFCLEISLSNQWRSIKFCQYSGSWHF